LSVGRSLRRARCPSLTPYPGRAPGSWDRPDPARRAPPLRHPPRDDAARAVVHRRRRPPARRLMKRRSEPEPLAQALASYLASSGLAARVEQAAVIPEWATLVGPQIAAVTEPLLITADGTMFVAVASSPWMAE